MNRPRPQHRFLFALILTLVVAGAFLFTHQFIAAAARTTPASTTLDATFKESETGTTVESSDKALLEPTDLEKPEIELVDVQGDLTPVPSASPTPTTTTPKIKPGDTLTYEVRYTPDGSPKNREFVLSYPDYVTVTNPVGGLVDTAKRTITWSLEHQAAGQLFRKKVLFKLNESVDLRVQRIDLVAVVRLTDRPRQKRTTIETPLQGEVTGTFTAHWAPNKSSPVPDVGMELLLVKADGPEKILGQTVTDYRTGQAGKFAIIYDRTELPQSDGDQPIKVRLRVTYQTPEGAADGQTIGYHLEALPNLASDEPYQLLTTAFALSPEKTTVKDLRLGTYRYLNDRTEIDIPVSPFSDENWDKMNALPVIWSNLARAFRFSQNLSLNLENLTLVLGGDEDNASYDNKTNTIEIGKDRFSPRAERYGVDELHEFGHHIFDLLTGSNHQYDRDSLLPPGVVKIPHGLIGNFDSDGHGGYYNDLTSRVLDEAFAEVVGTYYNLVLNGPVDQSCQWCSFHFDKNLRTDPRVPLPVFADFYPGYQNLVPQKDLASAEELAFYNFLVHYLAGTPSSFQGGSYGWTRQNAPHTDLTISWPSPSDESETTSRFKELLAALQVAKAHSPPTFREFYAGLKQQPTVGKVIRSQPDASLHPLTGLAILAGVFRDENCDWAWTPALEQGGQELLPAEAVGSAAHASGAQFTTSLRLFGARSWRHTPPTTPGARIRLAYQVLRLDQPLAAHIRLDYAPPFEQFSRELTVLFDPGQEFLPLELPNPLYRTRATITIKGSSTPPLRIDSLDYWQALHQESPPAYVANYPFVLDGGQSLVPELSWPTDLVVPAATGAIELMRLQAEQAPQTSSTPTTQPEITPSLVLTSETDEQGAAISATPPSGKNETNLTVTVQGYHTPQTLTLVIDGQTVGTRRLVTDQTPLKLILPDNLQPGAHTLEVHGEYNETATVRFTVNKARFLAARTGQIILILLLSILAVLLLALHRHHPRRHLLIILGLGAALVLIPTLLLGNSTTEEYGQTVKNGFIQLISNQVTDKDITDAQRTYLLASFTGHPESYFGKADTICFIQQASYRWRAQAGHPDEQFVIGDMSLWKGGSFAVTDEVGQTRSTRTRRLHQEGKSFDLVVWNAASHQSRHLIDDPNGGVWNQTYAEELAKFLNDTAQDMFGSGHHLTLLVTPPKEKNLDKTTFPKYRQPAGTRFGGSGTAGAETLWHVDLDQPSNLSRSFPLKPTQWDPVRNNRGGWPAGNGEDLALTTGAGGIYAIHDGTIDKKRFGRDRSTRKYYLYLTPTETPDPVVFYGNLDSVRVKAGQTVKAGQLLGVITSKTNGLVGLHVGVVKPVPAADCLSNETERLNGGICWQNPESYLDDLWHEVKDSGGRH